MPKLERDGVAYDLTSPVQVAAFKAAGFVEVEKVEAKPEGEKQKRSRKAKAEQA